MRNPIGTAVVVWFLTSIASAPFVQGALSPESVYVADTKKNQFYVHDGIIVGGDRAISDVIVRDIRRANNGGFERLVIDLEGSRDGEPAAIPRPPYFHVSVTPDEKRLVFTLWGHPKLAFDAKKIAASFKKSAVVKDVELLPRLNDENWTFVVDLKEDRAVEVFELANPVRIIVDIQLKQRAKR